MKKYIAYGSNMNMEQMKVRCPESILAGVTYIEDYALDFCAVATIHNKKE